MHERVIKRGHASDPCSKHKRILGWRASDEPKGGFADKDGDTRSQFNALLLAKALAVHEGPMGAADVLDPVTAVLDPDTGVATRNGTITRQVKTELAVALIRAAADDQGTAQGDDSLLPVARANEVEEWSLHGTVPPIG